MVKASTKYVCQQCGYESAKWQGKCPGCGEWNSLVETIVSTRSSKSRTGKSSNTRFRQDSSEAKPILLSSVTSKKTSRISTKISELDRVLGGGLVSGQVVLIAGEPGIGKSTVLLQLAEMLDNFLYVSGEESVNQIKIRADRLGVGKVSSGLKKKMIRIMEETDIDVIVDFVSTFKDTVFKGIVIDSIQTMTTADLSGMAGSVGQVRECAYRLVRLAKSTGIPILMVGHVTKEGSVAGPSVLMHLVDTVLWFEGDKTLTLRLLRAMKNRFGPTDEVGIFSMEDKGLIPMDAPEKIFLTRGAKKVAGSITCSIMQGTRPILIEVQALVVSTNLAFPRRIAQGIDSKRLELLIAVLTRRCGLPLYKFDCFVNIAGGISIKNDPSADLAICLAIASAYFDKALAKSTLAVGEVGLLGDIREVVAQEKRIKEAKRLGFSNVISSKGVEYLGQVIKNYLR